MSKSRRIYAAYLRRIAIWFVIAAVVLSAAVVGWAVRRWVWDVTDPLRFLPDAHRQCYWAVVSSGPEGFLNQYEKMAVQTRDWGVWLDYVPLRLLVMREWGVYLRHQYPETARIDPLDGYQRSYAFSAPLLRFNAAMDATAAVCAFLLTRLWVRRSRDQPSSVFVGIWQGMTAALLIWFNPAILLSAYAWPTWDSWIVPMYLGAVFLASVEWWFTAGFVIAIGAMLKGQQLAVAPIFVVWPMIQMRYGAAVRWCIGLVVGIALLASPWLMSSMPADAIHMARAVQQTLPIEKYPRDLFQTSRTLNVGALCWIAGVMIAAGVVPVVPMARLRHRSALLVRGIVLCLAIGWPWILSSNRSDWALALLTMGLFTWAVLRVRGRNTIYVVAAVAGATLLLPMRLFGTSHAWWDCGFAFGASRWHWTASSLTDNLPGLLFERFHWSKNPDDIAFTLGVLGEHWPQLLFRWGWWPACAVGVSAKQLFNPLFLIALLICAVGLSRAARRKDARTLVGLTTPWLVFFLLPVEIHGRYALYPAAISAICIGESIGMALLGMFITGAATVMILDALLQGGNRFSFQLLLSQRYPRLIAPDFVQTLYRVLERTHPDLAWGIFVAATVFIYMTLTKSRTHASFPRPTESTAGDTELGDISIASGR